MRLLNQKKGLTLLEVVLAMVLASAILAAIIILNAPFLSGFSEAYNFQKLRHQVSNPLESIQFEILNSRATYVDATQCYALCLVGPGTNRIYYYWSGSDLLKKMETYTNPISCADGKTYASSMDTLNSSFSQLGELVTLKLAATGPNTIFYRLNTAAIPNSREGAEPFYENFGCNSVSGKGWALEDTGVISWIIEPVGAGSSAYSLRESTTDSVLRVATAEIAVDLGRLDDAYLKFKYRAQGTPSTAEYLSLDYYNGTAWTEIFRDNLQGNLSPIQTTSIDLAGKTFSRSSRIRFNGYLADPNNHWVIDEISIVAK